MFSIYNGYKIYVCKDPIDMRNGFEGLSAEVIKVFDTSIISGGFFVFFNKKKNLIKILYWDIDGPAFIEKRKTQILKFWGKFIFIF